MTLRLASLALVFGLCLTIDGCAQTPSPHAYRDRSERAVSAVLSEVATVQLAVHGLDGGDLPIAYARIVISDSDDSVGKAITSYTSLDPPRAEQQLFDAISAQLSRAQDVVLSARIAASRSDSSQYPKLVRQLSRIASQLNERDQALQ